MISTKKNTKYSVCVFILHILVFLVYTSGQEAEVAKRRVHAAREQLATFVTDSLKEYISVMEEHLAREVKSLNSQVLVHALDKVFCKLHAIETMVPGTNLAQ